MSIIHPVSKNTHGIPWNNGHGIIRINWFQLHILSNTCVWFNFTVRILLRRNGLSTESSIVFASIVCSDFSQEYVRISAGHYEKSCYANSCSVCCVLGIHCTADTSKVLTGVNKKFDKSWDFSSELRHEMKRLRLVITATGLATQTAAIS
jgi:hypothetical protein